MLTAIRILVGLFFIPWGFWGIVGSDPANAVIGLKRIALSLLFIYGLFCFFPPHILKNRKHQYIYIITSILLVVPFVLYEIYELFYFKFYYSELPWLFGLILAFAVAPTSAVTARYDRDFQC